MTPEEMVKKSENYYNFAEKRDEENGEYSAAIVIARSNKAIYWMLRAIYAKLEGETQEIEHAPIDETKRFSGRW